MTELELFYTDDLSLVSQKEWHTRLEKIHEKKPLVELKTALKQSVRKRIPHEPCALLLSGGVDSSLLALLLQQENARFTAYTVGVSGSPDVIYATKIATYLKIPHKVVILSLEELEQILQKLAKLYKNQPLLKDVNPVVLFGVAAVEYAALELIQHDGIKTVICGAGIDEQAGGYNSHVKSNNVNAECWRRLCGLLIPDFIRDGILGTYFELIFRTPYLDPEVIACINAIPGSEKIVHGERKVFLRKLAEEQGVPKEIAWRKKQAAQYGSSIDKAIEKVAKKKRMGKRDYIQSLMNSEEGKREL